MDTKNTIIITLVVILIIVIGYFALSNNKIPENIPEENGEEIAEEEEENGEEQQQAKSLQELAFKYLGYPYERGPLSEEKGQIYRNDVFDSTTWILTIAAEHNFPDDPEEGMKQIHYFPPGEVSYENRLHFSSYRNKISDYFEDITRQVAEEVYESKTVLLNKEQEDEERLIDIDWEKEITLDFVRKEDVYSVLDNLPEVVGVMFIVDGDEEIGLDVRHEGLLLNGTDFIHVSAEKEEVVKEDFKDFLEDSNFDAVNFYELK